MKTALTRREFMQRAAAAGGVAAVGAITSGALRNLYADTSVEPENENSNSQLGYKPTIIPNGVKLPWKMVGGAKVFHLVAEPVDHVFTDGLMAKCWGYNGHVHGPTIEAMEGDLVRIYVTNKLPEPTTVHWHGVLLPNGMDGVGGLTQHLIQPGETFKYEFPLRQHGTFMYHPHHDEMTQMAMGLMGLFIIHPRKPDWPADRDFGIMLSEWRIDPGTYRPYPNEMTDFNVLTMNAKAFPGTEPLVVKKGDKVRIRFGNLGAMEHHPIHLHGYNFRVAETDGGRQLDSAQQLQTTVLVPVGTTRTIEFVADAPGDWAMHCHMTHHVMNQMGHNSLNLIGVNTDKIDQKIRKSLIPGFMNMGQDGMGGMGDMGMTVPKNSIPMVGGQGQYDPITMGGMFTILKVRDGLTKYDDPGWYQPPAGTLASLATKDDLRRDGIDMPKSKDA